MLALGGANRGFSTLTSFLFSVGAHFVDVSIDYPANFVWLGGLNNGRTEAATGSR